MSSSAGGLRVPPNSVEAERSVLGGLLLDNGAWESVAETLSEGDFYRRDHQLIFRGFSELIESDRPADAVTLAEYLDAQGLAEQTGGLAYLGQLTQDTPSASNIAAYAAIVRDRSVLRQLIEVGGQIAGCAYDTEGRAPAELIDEAERLVFQIAEQGRRTVSGLRPLKEFVRNTVDALEELHRSTDQITGLSTGFTEMDNMTSGLQAGDLIIIAGRPSMGKTSFAVNIAEHAALHAKVNAAVFSMEMSAESLAFRLISSLGRVNHGRLRNGSFADEDWPRITLAIEQMAKAPLFIDETPALTPTELRARARRMAREHGLGLIVVDYLQLMQGTSAAAENRATEISEISRGLKALAKELSVPVIALSQLNRSVEQRQVKRPQMSDLRESGAIEQDADLICFIYREEVYEKDTTRKGIADIIIAKQRNGPVGDFPLTFLGEYTRFENYSPEADYGADGGDDGSGFESPF
ncbi:MAG: replicative DNA helicase [Pseudomonadota bacterium]